MCYTTPFLALKYLPLFSSTYCRENLSAYALYTPSQQFYYELEYAVSEILFFATLGIFVGFENEKLQAVGISLKYNLR